MNGSLWLWMALALFLFWGVGVYNRLTRMRARGVAALRSVSKHMRQYAELVNLHSSHAASVASPSVEASQSANLPEWTQLLETLQVLDQALKDAKGEPLAIQSVARLGEAFEATQHLWQHWYGQPADLAGPAVPESMRQQWDAATRKVQTARTGLNQILATYNEAIEQFPARLLAVSIGFKPAGLM